MIIIQIAKAVLIMIHGLLQGFPHPAHPAALEAIPGPPPSSALWRAARPTCPWPTWRLSWEKTCENMEMGRVRNLHKCWTFTCKSWKFVCIYIHINIYIYVYIHITYMGYNRGKGFDGDFDGLWTIPSPYNSCPKLCINPPLNHEDFSRFTQQEICGLCGKTWPTNQRNIWISPAKSVLQLKPWRLKQRVDLRSWSNDFARMSPTMDGLTARRPKSPLIESVWWKISNL